MQPGNRADELEYSKGLSRSLKLLGGLNPTIKIIVFFACRHKGRHGFDVPSMMLARMDEHAHLWLAWPQICRVFDGWGKHCAHHGQWNNLKLMSSFLCLPSTGLFQLHTKNSPK